MFGQAGAFKNLPEFVVYSELLTTTKQYMRGVTAIDGSWLKLENLRHGSEDPSTSKKFIGSRNSTNKQSDSNGAGNKDDARKAKTNQAAKYSNPATFNRGAKRTAASLGNYVPVSKTKKNKKRL